MSCLNHREVRALTSNGWFLLGLAIQKGAPVLILPVTLAAIGSGIYSEYVLLYTLVQIIGIAGSLSVPQAVIPFWFGHEDKERFIGSVVAFSLVLQALTAPLAYAIVHLGAHYGVGNSDPVIVGLVILYAIWYALNTIALNLVRVTASQTAFVCITVVTFFCLVGMILLIRGAHGDKLKLFVSANCLAIALQTSLYFYFSGVRRWVIYRGSYSRNLLVSLLKFSVPMTSYTLVMLAALVADKWFIRMLFPAAVFRTYVIDFQFAFAVSLVSIVISMYNARELSRLLHLDDAPGVRSNVLSNYAISIAGSVLVMGSTFVYARLCHVHLSRGFWMLALAFTVNNCYAVNSALLTACQRTRRLAVIGAVSTGVLGCMLLLAGMVKVVSIIYASYMIYSSLLLVLSVYSIRSFLQPADVRSDLTSASVAR